MCSVLSRDVVCFLGETLSREEKRRQHVMMALPVFVHHSPHSGFIFTTHCLSSSQGSCALDRNPFSHTVCRTPGMEKLSQ